MPKNMPAILMAPKKRGTPKAAAVKKVVSPKKVLAKKAPEHKPEVIEVKSARQTWGTVVQTVMKKPRSWADWSARQLDANRVK